MTPTFAKPPRTESTDDAAERALRDTARAVSSPPHASLADRVVARLADEPAPSRGARVVPMMLAAAAALMVVAALAFLLAPASEPDRIAEAPTPANEPGATSMPDVRPMLLASATEALAEPIATYRAPIDWLSGPVARQAAGAIELLAQAGAAAPPEPTPRESS